MGVSEANKVWERGHTPSDEMDAPESLNSSEPIWTGKTRSCGRMLGMWLAANFLESGSKNSSSAAMVDAPLPCALPGLAMVQAVYPRDSGFCSPIRHLPMFAIKCRPCLSERTGKRRS
jgi:hypothetical protein